MAPVTSIVLEQVAHSEREAMRVRVEAVQGDFAGAVEFWVVPEALRAVGEALTAFPAKVPDDYEHYFEGESQNLQIGVQTTDRAGHCTIRVSLFSQDGEWSLRNVVEPAALHRLGEVFIGLARRNSGRVLWRSSEPGTGTD